jgi:O-antigen/teichoic acid export membrane protein
VFVAMGASLAAAAGVQFWTAREVARSGGVRVVGWVVRTHLVVLTAAMTIVGLVLATSIGAFVDVPVTVVWLAIGVAVTNAFQLVMLALPTGVRSMGVYAWVVIAAGLVYAGTNAGLLALDEASTSLVLVGMIAGNVVSVLMIAAWLRRAPRGTASRVQGRTAYGHAVRFGLPAGIGEIVLFAMLRVDVLIVAMFLPLRDVGWYAVATSLAEMLWVIPDSVSAVVLPTTSRDPAASRTTRLLHVSVVATVCAGAVLALVARPLTEALFGASFAPSAEAVPFLALASVAGGAWKIVGAEVVALGHTRPRLTSAITGLLAMVLVDLVAVPALGIAGAALGSAIGYTAAAIVVLRAWSGATDRPVARLLGLPRRVPAVEV